MYIPKRASEINETMTHDPVQEGFNFQKTLYK